MSFGKSKVERFPVEKTCSGFNITNPRWERSYERSNSATTPARALRRYKSTPIKKDTPVNESIKGTSQPKPYTVMNTPAALRTGNSTPSAASGSKINWKKEETLSKPKWQSENRQTGKVSIKPKYTPTLERRVLASKTANSLKRLAMPKSLSKGGTPNRTKIRPQGAQPPKSEESLTESLPEELPSLPLMASSFVDSSQSLPQDFSLSMVRTPVPLETSPLGAHEDITITTPKRNLSRRPSCGWEALSFTPPADGSLDSIRAPLPSQRSISSPSSDKTVEQTPGTVLQLEASPESLNSVSTRPVTELILRSSTSSADPKLPAPHIPSGFQDISQNDEPRKLPLLKKFDSYFSDILSRTDGIPSSISGIDSYLFDALDYQANTVDFDILNECSKETGFECKTNERWGWTRILKFLNCPWEWGWRQFSRSVNKMNENKKQTTTGMFPLSRQITAGNDFWKSFFQFAIGQLIAVIQDSFGS